MAPRRDPPQGLPADGSLDDAGGLPHGHVDRPTILEAKGRQIDAQMAMVRESEAHLVDLGTPLEFEPALPTETEPSVPAGLDKDAPDEPDTTPEHRQEQPDDVQPDTPADLQDSISSRLVSVIDREMTALINESPTHQSKLSTLQRSLRFALPELVRLRLQEEPAGTPTDDSDGPTEAGS